MTEQNYYKIELYEEGGKKYFLKRTTNGVAVVNAGDSIVYLNDWNLNEIDKIKLELVPANENASRIPKFERTEYTNFMYLFHEDYDAEVKIILDKIQYQHGKEANEIL